MSAVDVGIIGAGIYPFGRHPGVTGLQMAASAARCCRALPRSPGQRSPPSRRSPAAEGQAAPRTRSAGYRSQKSVECDFP